MSLWVLLSLFLKHCILHMSKARFKGWLWVETYRVSLYRFDIWIAGYGCSSIVYSMKNGQVLNERPFSLIFVCSCHIVEPIPHLKCTHSQVPLISFLVTIDRDRGNTPICTARKRVTYFRVSRSEQRWWSNVLWNLEWNIAGLWKQRCTTTWRYSSDP